jgi:xylan 1,4-beta-xylosidase
MKVLFQIFVCSLVLCCTVVFAQEPEVLHYRTVKVDAGKVTGEIRSFQGMNGVPSPVMAGLPNLVRQYKDLTVDQVRTHDVMGPTEIDSKFELLNSFLTWLIPDTAQRLKVVKAGNAGIIFPDWNADPDDAKSYNFGPTDKVISAIRESGAEVYYRIGRSFGANTNPPPDFDKFASVVQHIEFHYNQGWADGYHDRIRYWEFWNEPEIFWSGTPAQFYSLYEKTARALKAADPKLKVGGDAKAFPYDDGPYREGFIDYCVKHKVPLDFYSWHMYADRSADPYDPIRLAKQIRDLLDERDLTKTESILSAWNLSADFTSAEESTLRGPANAAYIDTVLSYFQDAPIDHAQFYRGDAAWMGLFDLQGNYLKTAHAFQAMARMLSTPRRLRASGGDTFGFAVLAGRSQDKNTVQVLISNYAIPAGYKPHELQMPPALAKSGPALPDFSKIKFLPGRKDIVYRDNAGYNMEINNLPWGNARFTVKRYRISDTQNLDLVEERSAAGMSFTMSTALAPDAVELIVLQRQ